MLQKIIFLFFILLSFTGYSKTFTVTSTLDTGQYSIRALLDSTSNGDTIIFDPSTDYKPIYLKNGQLAVYHSITILGNDSSKTLLNGNATSRIFEIVQTAVVKIANLSIYNGNFTSGGSGVLNSGTLELNACHIFKNTAIFNNNHVYGAGIFNYGKLNLYHSNLSYNVVYSTTHTVFGAGLYNNINGECFIKNSSISHNYVNGPDAYGGGFYNLGYLECEGSEIEYNFCYAKSYAQGAGFSNEQNATCIVTKSKVYGNTARANFSFSSSHGAGVYNNATLSMGEVSIDSNVCNSTFKSMGAGIYSGPAAICTVVNTFIKGNATYSDEESKGGGIFNSGNMDVYNSQITGNVSQGLSPVSGGGMYNEEFSIQKLINCTISGNKSQVGGGIYRGANSQVRLYNSILWNNLGTVSDSELGGSGFSLFYTSYVQGNNVGGFTGNEDPEFKDSISPYKAPLQDGDFSLSCASVLVDAGVDSVNKTLYDLGNSDRKLGQRIDLGAWEVNNMKDTTRISRIECDSFQFLGEWINRTQEYVFVLPNSSGCDSVVILNAKITYVSTRVIQNDNELIVDMFGLSQQWLRCDKDYAIIPGATMQSYVATEDGEYAAEVSLNGCKDTTLCYTVSFKGLDESNVSPILVFPNPSNGSFRIQAPEHIKIQNIALFNALGQPVEEIPVSHSSNFQWQTNQKHGVYTIRFLLENGSVFVEKLILE